MFKPITTVAALGAVFALSACTDPAYLDPNHPDHKRDQGAVIGGLVGAGLGALIGDDTQSAIIGAGVGALSGAAIGAHLDQQEAELRQQLDSDGITITNTGDKLIVSLPQDITFDTDSFVVRPLLRTDLGRVAAHLVKYPASTVQVVGHTDNVGSATYNIGLSTQRANSVADILQAGGVTYNRLQTVGLGEDHPVASNLTPEGRAQNRRVEIVIIPTQA